jgi:hypothetical protein
MIIAMTALARRLQTPNLIFPAVSGFISYLLFKRNDYG